MADPCLGLLPAVFYFVIFSPKFLTCPEKKSQGPAYCQFQTHWELFRSPDCWKHPLRLCSCSAGGPWGCSLQAGRDCSFFGWWGWDFVVLGTEVSYKVVTRTLVRETAPAF